MMVERQNVSITIFGHFGKKLLLKNFGANANLRWGPPNNLFTILSW